MKSTHKEKRSFWANLGSYALTGAIIGGGQALVRSLYNAYKRKRYSGRYRWEQNPEFPYYEKGFVYLDFDKRKLFDDEGNVLEDFSGCSDPDRVMAEFFNVLCSMR